MRDDCVKKESVNSLFGCCNRWSHVFQGWLLLAFYVEMFSYLNRNKSVNNINMTNPCPGIWPTIMSLPEDIPGLVIAKLWLKEDGCGLMGELLTHRPLVGMSASQIPSQKKDLKIAPILPLPPTARSCWMIIHVKRDNPTSVRSILTTCDQPICHSRQETNIAIFITGICNTTCLNYIYIVQWITIDRSVTLRLDSVADTTCSSFLDLIQSVQLMKYTDSRWLECIWYGLRSLESRDWNMKRIDFINLIARRCRCDGFDRVNERTEPEIQTKGVI